jgi:hypothetical protein
MKKANKTSPSQVDFSFEAGPPEPSRDSAAKIVSLSAYSASLAKAKRALLDQAIMARADHLTPPPRGLD